MDPIVVPSPGSDLELHSRYFQSVQLPLVVLKMFGVFPCRGLIFRNKNDQIRLHWLWVPVTLGMFIMIAITFIGSFLQLFAEVKRHNCVSSIAGIAGASLYYGLGILDALFLLLFIKDLQVVFQTWSHLEKNHLHYGEDKTLFRDSIVIMLTISISCIGDNVFFHLHSGKHRNGTNQTSSGLDFLEANCGSNFSWVEEQFGWSCKNLVVSIYSLLTNILVLILRNYCDIFLVVTCRALYKRYEILAERIQGLLERGFQLNWREIRNDHLEITKLTRIMDKMVSPFVFIGTISAAFHITLQVYLSLLPTYASGGIDNVYYIWSVWHLVLRGVSIAVSTILIHEKSIQPLRMIQQLRTEHYTQEVERFEKHLRYDPLGVTGFGCFIMTRSFILAIASFIFTVEILFLQAEDFTNAEGEEC